MQYSVKFVKNFILKQFNNLTHKILILSRIEKMVLVVLFCVTWLDFLKSHFKGPKYTISKSSFAQKSQMWWYESGNSGGCQKRKKLICGTEGEILVAHGRLPSPAPSSAMALVRCPNLFHLLLSFLIKTFMCSII